METELKLLIEPADADRLRQHPLLARYASTPPRVQALFAIYFDTLDYDLRQLDVGLRVRKVGKDWVQTLKAGGQTIGGLHKRHEWESRVDGPVPDLAALRKLVDDNSIHPKLLKRFGRPGVLRQTFTTNVQRTLWDLHLPDGDEVECVLDEGSIDFGADKVDISELELELKAGKTKRLFDLALELHRDVSVHIGNLSKADRGYALIRPVSVSATKAKPVLLTHKMTIETAFKAVVENCLEQIQANEPGVTRLHAVESLHQMRVGLRRLRAALSVFRQVIRCPDGMRAELKWLATELGAARDWDVLTGPTLSKIESKIADNGMLAAVRTAAQERATRGHESAAAAVLSPRYSTLILRFCSWMEGTAWRKTMTGAETRRLALPAFVHADRTLTSLRKGLRKQGSRLEGAEAEARHRVRISAKKTRYAMEFFASLYRPKAIGRSVKTLSRLQDELGWLNDTAVAKTLLQELKATHPEAGPGIDFVRGYLTCYAIRNDVAAGRLAKQFKTMTVHGLERNH